MAKRQKVNEDRTCSVSIIHVVVVAMALEPTTMPLEVHQAAIITHFSVYASLFITIAFASELHMLLIRALSTNL